MSADLSADLSADSSLNADNSIEVIAQGMVADAEHYVDSVTAMAANHDMTATEDIVSSQGIKLVARGTHIDSRLRAKLGGHRLGGTALEKKLLVAGGVTPESLAIEIDNLIEGDAWLSSLANKSGDPFALRHASARLNLPQEILFRLTVARDQRPVLYLHSLSVTIISHYLALRLELKQTAIDNVLIAALCHDLGELYTAPEILDAAHRVTDAERRFIDVHPVTSWLIVRDLPQIDAEVARAVLQHQERLDGSGYPNGLKDDAIGLEGRILAVADIAASILLRFRSQHQLSTSLRLNFRKYDAKIVGLLHEAISTGAAVSPSLAVAELGRHLAALASLLNGWARLRGEKVLSRVPAVAFLFERMYNLHAMVIGFGFDPDSLDMPLALATEDAAIAAELSAVIDELKFQLADLAREAARRQPEWQSALDATAVDALTDWLGQLICMQSAEAEVALAAAGSTAPASSPAAKKSEFRQVSVSPTA